MIPRRGRAPLPAGHWWVIIQHDGERPTVYLSDQVPVDSALEQELVRAAVRAWTRRHGGGLAPLIPIAATGGWAAAKLKHPVTAGAGVVVAGSVVAAAMVLTPHSDTPTVHAPATAPPILSPSTPERMPSPARRPRPGPSGPSAVAVRVVDRPVQVAVSTPAGVSTSVGVPVAPVRAPLMVPPRVRRVMARVRCRIVVRTTVGRLVRVRVCV